MRPSVRPSVRASVRPFTNSILNISKITSPIAIKFYLKHHWGGVKVTLGFWPDRIRALVSMATDSYHCAIMGENVVATLATSFLTGSSSFLGITRTTITSRMSSNFG